MHKILVLGAGQIGSLIAFLLAKTQDYQVYLADVAQANPNIKRLPKLAQLEIVQLDARLKVELQNFIEQNKITAIVSSLPFYANIDVAKVASACQVHYFDLTEDVQTTNAIMAMAQGSKHAYVPQCGLAPGFISIVADHLVKRFPDKIETVKMRVGALPVNISNALQYSLTWSIDGLINEYGNPCEGLQNGEEVSLPPLENLEEIQLDGLTYEAFNTSGGVGSLVKTYAGKVKHLSYKTIRYPGHCEKMRFLMNDLQLNEDRDTLKQILEKSLPRTYQDMVLIYVSVSGMKDGMFLEENYVKKFYPRTLDGIRWSAIQMTTASGMCTAVDLVMSQPKLYQGFVRQEQFSFDALTANRFGKYYAESNPQN